jgi:hypothetical protein
MANFSRFRQEAESRKMGAKENKQGIALFSVRAISPFPKTNLPTVIVSFVLK